MKTSTISARIDPKLKEGAERVFRHLGLTSSQAITLFYRQVEMQRGLPFNVHIPSETTRQALEDVQNRRSLLSYESIDGLVDELDVK